jgi:hypothetical protein
MKKTDANHKSIMHQFRQLGFSVLDLSAVGKGCPDILIARHGINTLVEIKTAKGKMNDRQKEFCDKWEAKVYTVRDIDDALVLSVIIKGIKDGLLPSAL